MPELTATELHVLLDAIDKMQDAIRNGATPWTDYTDDEDGPGNATDHQEALVSAHAKITARLNTQQPVPTELGDMRTDLANHFAKRHGLELHSTFDTPDDTNGVDYWYRTNDGGRIVATIAVWNPNEDEEEGQHDG